MNESDEDVFDQRERILQKMRIEETKQKVDSLNIQIGNLSYHNYEKFLDETIDKFILSSFELSRWDISLIEQKFYNKLSNLKLKNIEFLISQIIDIIKHLVFEVNIKFKYNCLDKDIKVLSEFCNKKIKLSLDIDKLKEVDSGMCDFVVETTKNYCIENASFFQYIQLGLYSENLGQSNYLIFIFSMITIQNVYLEEKLYLKSNYDLKDFKFCKKNFIFLEKTLNNHLIKTVRNNFYFKEAYYWFEKLIFSNEKLRKQIKDLAPFGSVTQLTNNKFSDLDVCLMTIDKENVSLLYDIKDFLFQIKGNENDENSSLFELGELYYAKNIPLLSLMYKEKIKVEISLNNCLGVYNSQLLRIYSLFDSRVLMLSNIVKDWSKEYKINGNYHHYLSSFSYTILVLFFLIQKEVIPPFNFIQDNKIKIDFTYHNDIYNTFSELIIPNSQDLSYYLDQFSTTNKQSIAELFTEFLVFYGYIFNSELFYIDIREKSLNFRLNENEKKKGYINVFSIIYPFDLSYNPGFYFNKNNSQERDFYRIIHATLEMISQNKQIFN